MRGREGEKERERERERETERQTDRQTDRQTETERQRAGQSRAEAEGEATELTRQREINTETDDDRHITTPPPPLPLSQLQLPKHTEHPPITPLSHERLVANAHELGTSQDSLETSQYGLGCVLARPCMSRQVTETEREIPFFSHRLVAAVDFILSREIKFSAPPATKMQLNCTGPSRLVPAS